MAGNFQEVGVRAVVQGYADYMAKTQAMDKAVAGMGKGFGTMAKGAAVGAAALGGVAAMGGMIVKSAIGASAQMETYTTQFKVLLGGADAAKDRIAELAKFANTTPFELPEVVQASKLLQTFGGTALATGDTLTLVGDMAAASGASFGELATWVGRAYTNIQGGRPFGEAAMRLQELGLMSGVTRTKLEEMTKAGASSAEVWAAFTGSMDKYKGMMVDLSETFTGLTSTMSDSWKELLRQFGAPIMEPAKDVIKTIIDFLANPAVVAGASDLGEAIGGVVQQLADMAASGASPAAEHLGDVLSRIADRLKDMDIKEFFEAASDPNGILAELAKALTEAASAFGELGMGMGSVLMPLLPEMLRALTPLMQLIADSPPLVHALTYAFVAMKLKPIIDLFLALSGVIVGRLVPATVAATTATNAQTAALTAQQMVVKSAAAANAALAGSLLMAGGLIAGVVAAGTAVGFLTMKYRDNIDQVPILGGLIRGTDDNLVAFNHDMEVLSASMETGLVSTQAFIESGIRTATKALAEFRAQLAGASWEEVGPFGEAETARVSGNINKVIDSLIATGATYEQVTDVIKAAGLELADVTSKSFQDMIESNRLYHEVVQSGLDQDVKVWGRAAVGISTEAGKIGKALEETGDKAEDATARIASTLESLLPELGQTFESWRGQLDMTSAHYVTFQNNLTKIYAALVRAGVQNVDALIKAIATKGPEFTAYFGKYITELPLAELQAVGAKWANAAGTDTEAIIKMVLSFQDDAAAAGAAIGNQLGSNMVTSLRVFGAQMVADMGNILDHVSGTGLVAKLKIQDIAATLPPIEWSPLPESVSSGAAGEAFRGLDQDLADLRSEMTATAQEGVGQLNWAIEGEQHALDGLAVSLGDAQEQHAALEEQLKSSTDAMNEWENAVLKGTDAYDDTAFAFSQSMDRIQLSINKLELQKLGLEPESKSAKALDAQIEKLNDELDVLRLKAANSKLEESLKLEPQRRELEERFNPALEYTKEQILSGWEAAKESVDEYGVSVVASERYIKALGDAQKEHQDNIEILKASYSELEKKLTDINPAIKAIWEARGDPVVKSIDDAFAALDRGQTDAATAAMNNAMALFDEIKAAVPEAQQAAFQPVQDFLASMLDVTKGGAAAGAAIAVATAEEIALGFEHGLSEADKAVAGWLNSERVKIGMEPLTEAAAAIAGWKSEGRPATEELLRLFGDTASGVKDVKTAVDAGSTGTSQAVRNLLDPTKGTAVSAAQTAQSQIMTNTWLEQIRDSHLTTIKEMRDYLKSIDESTSNFVAAVPAAQCGMDVAQSGLAMVHKGEIVVPAEEAGGGGSHAALPSSVGGRVAEEDNPTARYLAHYLAGMKGAKGGFEANITVDSSRDAANAIGRKFKELAFEMGRA